LLLIVPHLRDLKVEEDGGRGPKDSTRSNEDHGDDTEKTNPGIKLAELWQRCLLRVVSVVFVAPC
jgi:hypothetical protein